MKTEIELDGWALVHTYRESHGDFVKYIYQNVTNHPYERKMLFEHTKHLHSNRFDGVTSIREGEGNFRDYLLATTIEKDLINNGNNYILISDKTSPCYTAGYTTYYHRPDAIVYQITIVAGHGHWATKRDATDEEIAQYEI